MRSLRASRKRPVSRKSYRKRARAPVRAPANKRVLTALIRRTVMRVSEPKMTLFNFGKIEMYHNGFNVAMNLNSPQLMPTQGTADTMRVGDQINTTHIRVRSLFGQKGDRPNVNFIWYLIEAPRDMAATYNNFFHNITANCLIDEPNLDSIKVLSRGNMRPNQAGLTATGNDEFTFSKYWSFPHKRTYKFGPADATTSHNQANLWLVIMAYDAYGTILTDNIAYINSLVTVHYKDP